MANTTSTLLQIVDLEEGANADSWGPLADTNWTYLENAIANVTTVNSTGGTETLTNDENRSAILLLTGTLASNLIVEVRASSKSWIVLDSTTRGAYTVTIQPAGGSAIAVPVGVPSLFYCDATTIYEVTPGGDVTNPSSDDGMYLNATGDIRIKIATTDVVAFNATGVVLEAGYTFGAAVDIISTPNITDGVVTLPKLATQADATLIANTTGGVASPIAATLTAVLDDMVGSTRGMVLYRNATVWASLALGTTGQALYSDGTDVAWGGPSLANTTTGSVCLQRVRSEITSPVTCGVMPVDATIPQNTEGTEIITRSITPVSASSTLVVKFGSSVERVGLTAYAVAALFRDSTAGALGAVVGGLNATGFPVNDHLSAEWEIASGSTSATTFKIRAGGVASIKLPTTLLGGVDISYLTIEEWLTV